MTISVSDLARKIELAGGIEGLPSDPEELWTAGLGRVKAAVRAAILELYGECRQKFADVKADPGDAVRAFGKTGDTEPLRGWLRVERMAERHDRLLSLWRLMVEPQIEAPSASAFVPSPYAEFTGRGAIVAAGPDPSDRMAYFVWLAGPGQGWCADAGQAMARYRAFMNPDATTQTAATSQRGVSITPTAQLGGPDSIAQEV